MNKKILTLALLLGFLTVGSANATTIWQKFVNANKAVANEIITSKEKEVSAVAQAKINAYEKQITAKQNQIDKVKENETYTLIEKWKKIKKIRSEIREINAEIKALK